MTRCYCYKCATAERHVTPELPTNLIEEQYQLDKFIKHTAPTGTYEINSVFSDPTVSKYEEYIVATAASGCVEVDDRGRKNMLWFAGEETGLTTVNGTYEFVASGVMLVLPENARRIHAFPLPITLREVRCDQCGEVVPYARTDLFA